MASHPFGTALGPLIDGLLVVAHAKPMTTCGEQMNFGGELFLFVFEVELSGGDWIQSIITCTD